MAAACAAPIKSCQAPSVTDRPQRRRKGMAADSGLLFQQDTCPPVLPRP
jgi:hypothetical protein